MRKYEEQLSPEAVLLNQYLNQYKTCIGKKKTLEHRKNDIMREFDNPLGAMKYDGMPRGSGVGLGCAALTFRLDEIETRITEQMNNAAKALSDILNIIEFLPENSMERIIIEHKYIDRFSWNKICMIEHISRTPATRYWRKGLYDLLEFAKVQQIIHDFRRRNTNVCD